MRRRVSSVRCMMIFCYCAVAAGLTLQSSPWPTAAGDSQRTGWTNSTFPLQEPSIAWEFTISPDIPGCSKKTNSIHDVLPFGAITRGDGIILVLQVKRAYRAEMTLLAVHPSGQVEFNATGMPFASVGDAVSGAVLSDDSVIVSARGSVLRVSKEGEVVWKVMHNGSKEADAISEPLVAGSVAIVTGLECNLYDDHDGARRAAYAGLSLATGETVWTAALDSLYGYCSTPTLSADGKSAWVVATGNKPYSARYALAPATGRFLCANVSFPTIGNPAFTGERKNVGVGDAMWLLYNEGDPACWPHCGVSPRLFRVHTAPPFATAGVTALPKNISEDLRLTVSVASDRTRTILYSFNGLGDLFAIDADSGHTKWVSHACRCPSDSACADAPYLWGDGIPYLKRLPPAVDTAGNVLTAIGTKLCLVGARDGATLWTVDLETQWHVAAPTFGADGAIFAVTANDQHGTRLVALRS